MKIAILHYSVPPVVGGVEAVIRMHTALLLQAGYTVTLIAGAGDRTALPEGAEFIRIPEMDSRHRQVARISKQLEGGKLEAEFEDLTAALREKLRAALKPFDTVIVHNIFSKHFNLPLTAALYQLLDQGEIARCIAWCHDISWTSAHSAQNLHDGYPWDLLRTYKNDVIYVAVSKGRQGELAGLFDCPLERIRVIYNGVDREEMYGYSEEGRGLIRKLDLGKADLIMLMPVRITQAKNIELALGVTASLKQRGWQVKLVVTGPPDPHDPEDKVYYQSLLKERQRLEVVDEARFVYESGTDEGAGYVIGMRVVSELYRTCDMLFMPSHREGFGMPVLEAGLAGMPVFTTDIPAAVEIGGRDVVRFSPDASADEVADLVQKWAESSPVQRLRRRVRQEYTWQAIFQNDILPLIEKEGAR